MNLGERAFAAIAFVSVLAGLVQFFWQPSHNVQRIMRIAAVSIGLPGLGYFGIGWFVPDPWNKVNGPKSTEVTMTTPDSDDDNPVPMELIVAGSVAGLPQGSALWAIHRLVGTSAFFLASGPCVVSDNDNNFACPRMFVGQAGDTTRSFEISVWIVDGKGQNELIEVLRDTPPMEAAFVTNQPQGVQPGPSVVRPRS